MPVTVTETSAIFTAAVTLEQAEPEHFDLAFTAVTQPCPWPKAYGGDLVAAAAAAAMRSVTDGKTLHSMHSYFLRPAADLDDRAYPGEHRGQPAAGRRRRAAGLAGAPVIRTVPGGNP